MLVLLLLLSVLPYILCVIAINRKLSGTRAFVLILRSTIFLGAIKAAAIGLIAFLARRGTDAGMVASWYFALLLFPENFVGPMATTASTAAAIQTAVLAILFSFLWGTLLVAFVKVGRRLKGPARLSLMVWLVAGPVLQVSAADTALPRKSTKLIIKITQDKKLWFFGTGVTTPSGFTSGATQVTLTASGRTTGTFKWDVVAGADKVKLEGGGASITKTDDNTLNVTSVAPSVSKSDVSIRLTYGAATATKKLEVRAPKSFTPVTTADAAAGLTCTADGDVGWRSGIVYTVNDNVGGVVPNVPVNETIGQKTSVETNNWGVPAPFATGTDGNAQFFDLVCVTGISFTPQPQVPGNPLSSRLIDKVGQAWFVGSTTPGVGIRVQSDNAARFIDHGRHVDITSP